MASLQGWGRQTWNSGAWDTFAPVNDTGNGLSSSVGTVSLVTTNVFGVTGFQITSSIGEASQASEYAATGNALTSTAGTMPNPTIVDNQLLTGWNRGVGTTVPLGWSTSSWGNGDFILSTANGLSGDTAVCDFGDISFTSATISAQAAVIYNSSTVSGLTTNASVCVLDFGAVKTSTAGTFTITFPAAESTAAIIRIA